MAEFWRHFVIPVAAADYGRWNALPMGLGRIIREWREANGYSQGALAKRLNVEGQTISNIETGKTKSLRSEALHRFAELSGIPAVELTMRASGVDARTVEGSGSQPTAIRGDEPDRVKLSAVMAKVSAGRPEIREAEQVEPGAEGYRIRVDGESMSPKYVDGATVWFSRRRALADGGVVFGRDYLIWLSNEASTFKQVAEYRRDQDMLILRAINPDKQRFPDRVVHKQDIEWVARADYVEQRVD